MKEGISIDIGKFEVTRFIYLVLRERLSTDFGTPSNKFSNKRNIFVYVAEYLLTHIYLRTACDIAKLSSIERQADLRAK